MTYWWPVRNLNLSTDAISALKEHSAVGGDCCWDYGLIRQNPEWKKEFLYRAKCIMAIIYEETNRKEWNPSRVPWNALEETQFNRIMELLPENEVFYLGSRDD